MLASPSDVNEERQVAREIILDWNNINSLLRNIVLLPIGWEYNAVPTMGERPQEIINKQVLKNADLLIGIFWTRIGTPTGKAVSGSVEEIEKHIDSGKPAMLYFSNKPVMPSSINQEQYQAVEKLKKEYQSKGLTETFDTVEDFRSKFQRHLSMKLNNDKFFAGYLNDNIDRPISGFNNKRKTISLLSDQARTLLIEAVKDSNGQIVRIAFMDMLEIQTNERHFVNKNDPKSRALWTSALEELENKGLVRPIGYKREIFEVTQLGYQVAES
ncbi:MAG: hypothetical protein ACO1OF_19685 [Adhaeribacter sp.]